MGLLQGYPASQEIDQEQSLGLPEELSDIIRVVVPEDANLWDNREVSVVKSVTYTLCSSENFRAQAGREFVQGKAGRPVVQQFSH